MGRKRTWCTRCMIGFPPDMLEKNLCRRCVPLAEEEAARAKLRAREPDPPAPEPTPSTVWPDDAEPRDWPPEHVTTEEELAACLGEGLGPDDPPDVLSPRDRHRADKLERMRRYHADILAGRPINWIPCGQKITRYDINRGPRVRRRSASPTEHHAGPRRRGGTAAVRCA